jgi:hypothetical protein
MTRETVYKILDGERAYQDRRWTKPDHNHSWEEWIMYMEHYIAKAKEICCTADQYDATYNERVGANMRKVTALGIAAAEQHGFPGRTTL